MTNRVDIRAVACATGFALIVACLVPPACGSSLERRIVPGRSIGGFSLGEDVGGLVGALGPLYGTSDLPNDNLEGYYWPLKRVGAVVERKSNKIIALATSLDDGYLTDNGIGAGARLDAVRRVFGEEDAIDPAQAGGILVYDALGIAFVVNDAGALEGRVSAVFVFQPGRSRDIFPL